MTAPERYLIDASAFWRIKRDPTLGSAWESHLDRGLVLICPVTELEICHKASRPHHETYTREFATTYLRTELHHDAGNRARDIQQAMVAKGTNSGAGPIDLLLAATAWAYRYVILHDDGDYDAIAHVCNGLEVRNVHNVP